MYQSPAEGTAKPQKRKSRSGFLAPFYLLVILLLLAAFCGLIMAQAGRRQRSASDGGVSVSVVAKRDDKSAPYITSKQVALYDNGVEQTIRNFSPDPSPARIVLLVDNSLTVRADVEKLEQAAIVADWTDNAKSIEASLKGFRKKGQPHLFDALSAVIDQALRPLAGQKRAIVVISDGLDRGSKTSFEKILADLQANDITVYAV